MALIPRERVEEFRVERIAELQDFRRAGIKVIGYFSYYAPVEIIRVAGAIPVRLMRGGYDAEVRGERYLRSDACPVCLSTMGNFDMARSERAADSLYALVDAIVGVNTCDLLHRLPESIHRYFNLPVFELYMPRTSEPLPHRLTEFKRQLEWLAAELAAFTGQEFERERLTPEVRSSNHVRGLLRTLDDRRKHDGPALTESDVLNLVTLATILDGKRFAQFAADVELKAGSRPRSSNRSRLMLGGSEVAEQDRWLVETIEQKADIVTDLLSEGTRWFADDCNTEGDAMDNLTNFYFTRSPCMTRRPNDEVYANAQRRVEEFRVHGLVYKTLLYCDPWNFEAVRLRKEIGIPMLHIDGNYSTENREQLRTRVEAFLENL